MAIAMQHLLSDIERLIKSQKYIAGSHFLDGGGDRC
jgi:hypothetical protein